jgi:hypothetical protein
MKTRKWFIVLGALAMLLVSVVLVGCGKDTPEALVKQFFDDYGVFNASWAEHEQRFFEAIAEQLSDTKEAARLKKKAASLEKKVEAQEEKRDAFWAKIQELPESDKEIASEEMERLSKGQLSKKLNGNWISVSDHDNAKLIVSGSDWIRTGEQDGEGTVRMLWGEKFFLLMYLDDDPDELHDSNVAYLTDDGKYLWAWDRVVFIKSKK